MSPFCRNRDAPRVREPGCDRHDSYAVFSRVEHDRFVWWGDSRDDARALCGRKYSDARDHDDEGDEETTYRIGTRHIEGQCIALSPP